MKVYASISKENFKEKPTAREWARMEYQYKHIGIMEFWNAMLNGYAFTSVFKYGEFTPKQKTKENFKGTQIISIDIDNALSSTTLQDFINECQTKPTLSYITPSHLKEDENGEVHARFRLIYACDAVITNTDTYKALYKQIYNGIPQTLLDPNKKEDNCGASPYQQFGGNAKAYTWRFDAIYEGNILKIKDLNDRYEGIVSAEEFAARIKAIQEGTENKHAQAYSERKEAQQESVFLADLNTLSPTDFLGKYASVYEYITATKIEFNGELYKETPTNYTEIERRYNVTRQSNGKTSITPYIYKDGEQRRKTMYLHSVIRRQIKPTITQEELIYNLVFDRLYFYDNSDNQLNNNTLQQIADNALKATYTIPQRKRKKFKINKEECKRQGINTKVMVRKAAKEINYTHIGQLYDTSKGVTENLKELNDHGVKVCRRTLYNFCKEMGINPKGTAYTPKTRKQATTKIKDNTIKTKVTMKDTESRNEQITIPYKPLADLFNLWQGKHMTRQEIKIPLRPKYSTAAA